MLTLIITLAACLVVSAQTAPATPAAAERVAALKQALAENQAALRQYTWTESTEISLKGEVKKREKKICRYGADGKVQKTPAPGDESQPQEESGGRRRGGRVKQHVVDKKVGEMKDYMQRVTALVQEYVPPESARIQAAAAAGTIAAQPDPTADVSAVRITSYFKPGDSLGVAFNRAAKSLERYEVASYVDDPKDDVVTLAVQFGRLDDGTSYPREIVLDAKAKQIQVKVTNSGYARLAQ